ncbi:MAG: hypothetical protein ACJ8DJ_03375, partial [Gemmatimonadales bacterium]
ATTVGSRLQLRWRIRLTPHDGPPAVLVEQTAYFGVGSQVQQIDLLCSGFVPERTFSSGG